MGGHNCAVIGCHSSYKRIQKWRAENCPIHEGKTRKQCGCWLDPPYKMYCFPSELKHSKARKNWILALRRVDKDNKAWKPCSSDRVCSKHFVDGVPTPSNPDPTVDLDYKQPKKKCRRVLFRKPIPKSTSSTSIRNSDQVEPMDTEQTASNSDGDNLQVVPDIIDTSSESCKPISIDHDHSYVATPTAPYCTKCQDKDALVESLVKKINRLSVEVRKANRKRLLKVSTPFSWRHQN